VNPVRREALGAIRVAQAEASKYEKYSPQWMAAYRKVAFAQIRAIDVGCTVTEVNEASE
jgi:hypothetical protein